MTLTVRTVATLIVCALLTSCGHAVSAGKQDDWVLSFPEAGALLAEAQSSLRESEQGATCRPEHPQFGNRSSLVAIIIAAQARDIRHVGRADKFVSDFDFEMVLGIPGENDRWIELEFRMSQGRCNAFAYSEAVH